jgi:hypothetical protein
MAKSEVDTLVQILAVLIDRLGGEVVVSKREFDMYEDVPVLGKNISSDYTVLRLGGGVMVVMEPPSE